MSNYEIIIKVDIQKTEASTSDSVNKCNDGSFRMVLPQESAQSIDTCEKALLRANCPALREALSLHLSEISKEEAYSCNVGQLKKTQQTIK
ncbi:MAG: hypothetical protein JRG68_06765 [Deltaproteobacteria bacterium]|nr:hypothetical protein [Deltaproteobacteria bacterium]